MVWCRCEQRPPLPGADLCSLCLAKNDASRPTTAPVEESPEAVSVGDAIELGEVVLVDPLQRARRVALASAGCCLALVLALGIFVGWILRGL